MKRDESISLLAFAVLGFTLLFGVHEGLWPMSSVLQYMPYFIMAGMGGVLIWGFRERIERVFKRPSAPKLVVEVPKLPHDKIPKEIHVRLLRGGEVKIRAYFKFIKILRVEGSVPDLIGYFSLDGDDRVPFKFYTSPLKATWTVTQTPEIEVIPDAKNPEEFVIAFLNDEKWGHNTISLNEGRPEHIVPLFFGVKLLGTAIIPSDSRRYLGPYRTHRLDLFLAGTGLPLYKAASFSIDSRDWLYNVKLLSEQESKIPQIEITPAEDASRLVKEIRISLKDGVLVYPARFYFVRMKNLTGPTVNDLEVVFRASHGGGAGLVLMIASREHSYLTIHMEDDTIEEFNSRKHAIRLAFDPEYIHSEERTVLHKGALGKTFAILHTVQELDGVYVPSLESLTFGAVDFSQATKGFTLDLFVSGDTYPTRQCARFRVKAHDFASLEVEPIPFEKTS